MNSKLRTSPRFAAAALLGAALVCTPSVRSQAQEVAKLTASAPSSGALFGHAVAVDADTMVVGEPLGDAPALARSGLAHVFVRSGSMWSGQAVFQGSDTQLGDFFGESVAVDGNTLVVGAPQHDNGTAFSNIGAAYVFVRTGTTWSQQAKLMASDATRDDLFGQSVALDGDTIVVGASFGDHPSAGPDTGAAYVFTRSGTVWTEQAKLVASTANSQDLFGESVCISGETVLIGARSATDPTSGFRSGTASVFTRVGTTWSEEAVLASGSGSVRGWFGHAVALDGDTALVGAPLAQTLGVDSGAAYVFTRNGTVWTREAPLIPGFATLRNRDDFGWSVALRRGAALVGAPLHAVAPATFQQEGAAFLFTKSGASWATGTRWVRLIASDPAAQAEFGAAVAMSSDAAVIGAPRLHSLPLTESGASYAFAVTLDLQPRDIALVDIDADGDLDGITANAGRDNLSLYPNDGAGALGPPIPVALTLGDAGPVALADGDLDGDGFADDLAVACADSGTIAIVTNAGSASPVATSGPANGLRPVSIAVGDLDGVSPDDILIAREGEPVGGGQGLAVSLNGGPFVDLAGAATVAVRVRDLDGDGDQDVVAVGQSPGRILLFAGDGAGNLTAAGEIPLPTGLANGLCCDDLDGDGDVDLTVALPTLFPVTGNTVRIYAYADDGSGALDPADYTVAADVATGGTFATDVACGELEDDGIPGFTTRRDVVVVHTGSGDVEIHGGFDGAVFASVATPTVGATPVAAAVGDLNGDGGDDVVIANQGSGDITVLLTPTPALVQDYGIGCSGTGGLVPNLTASGLPAAGSAFGLQLDNARAFAPALLLFAGAPGNAALPGGCSLLVGAPLQSILRFTDGIGTDGFGFGIPALPGVLGVDVFFQYAVFDPAGAFGGVLALSNGLRIQIAN